MELQNLLGQHDITDPSVPGILEEKCGIPHYRSEYVFPQKVYLCGNSLGLLPAKTKQLIAEELQVWGDKGVHGHFDHPFGRPWVSVDDNVVEESAKIVGAQRNEVAIMNSLTANLHFLMISFYRPEGKRFKIIMESHAFPSDYYAIESQVKFHGYDPKDAIIQVSPRENEYTLRMGDIIDIIRKNGDAVALILFSGVQYYTGQWFDLELITKVGHEVGAIVGFDLAHAAGNVPLNLHSWDVDFACWVNDYIYIKCTYKYLNSGPGGIGGAFVHEKYIGDETRPKLTGWWGTDPSTKFLMDNIFRPIPGANVYRLSNPNVMATTCLLGSLSVFGKTSMMALRKRSLLLTGYLEALLKTLDHFIIITPSNPDDRGCQLSLLFDDGYMEPVFEYISKMGVVVDERRPNVIRVAPAPLYNTFEDVFNFYTFLKEALSRI